MSPWTWEDTLWLAIVLGVWLFALTYEPPRPTPARQSVIPTDTIGCGHLEKCVPRERVRWMSHNPFAS